MYKSFVDSYTSEQTVLQSTYSYFIFFISYKPCRVLFSSQAILLYYFLRDGKGWMQTCTLRRSQQQTGNIFYCYQQKINEKMSQWLKRVSCVLDKKKWIRFIERRYLNTLKSWEYQVFRNTFVYLIINNRKLPLGQTISLLFKPVFLPMLEYQ